MTHGGRARRLVVGGVLVLGVAACGGTSDDGAVDARPAAVARVAATSSSDAAGAAGPDARAAPPGSSAAARAAATADAAAPTPGGSTDATSPAAPATTAAAATGSPAPDPPPADRPLRGRTIVLDPGHNGGNAEAAARVNRPVSIGNGTKACDTTGTESVRGLAEHRFTWLVAQHVRRELRARGARVVLTRADDAGVGPCITRRLPRANRIHADVAVSIHADGGPPGGRGFHVILPGRVPSLAGHDRIVAPSARLGRALRAAFRTGTGMPVSTYLGRRGLDVRTDLGGLNLVRVPAVLLETGNMRNATDAALMSDPAWRRRAGRAIARGVQDGLAALGR